MRRRPLDHLRPKPTSPRKRGEVNPLKLVRNTSESRHSVSVIAEILRTGYSESRDESLPGVGSLGIAVTRRDTNETIGVAVSYPSHMTRAEERARLWQALRAMAIELGRLFDDPIWLAAMRRLAAPGKTVEADETSTATTSRAKMTRRLYPAWSSAAAMLLRAFVQARTKNHIVPHIVRFVKEGSRVHTDEASNFKLLTEKYGHDHEAIDHYAKEYVRGDVRTNSIEPLLSQVKRGINGAYVWVSKKH